MAPLVLAQIGVPTAAQCFEVLAPIGALLLLNWIFHNTDRIIHQLFPHLAWERQLGWFNMRARRRAATFLRSLGYLLYGLLAVALYGIVWGAEGVSQFGNWIESPALLEVPVHLLALVTSLGFWIFYLAGDLIPRLRREYEEEDLARYRAERAELEPEPEEKPAIRNSPAGKASLLGHKIHVARPRD